MIALAASMTPMFFRIVLLMEKIGLNMGALLLYQKIVVGNEGKMRELGNGEEFRLTRRSSRERSGDRRCDELVLRRGLIW